MKLDSKYFDKIRVKPSTEKKAADTIPQCEWPDCPRPGRHKAPMGRGHEGKFYNYCTEHVQEYNKTYNYFSGMKDDEMQEFQKEARLGHRPTDCVPLKRRLESLEPATIGLGLGERDLILSQRTSELLVVLHEQRAQQPERTVRLVHAHD